MSDNLKFYKNYITINEYDFTFSSVSGPGYERNLNIQNIPNSKAPIIQDNGQKERRINVSISVIGDKRVQYQETGTYNYNQYSSNTYEYQSSFDEKRNFIEKISTNKNYSNNIKVILPDGNIYKCLLASCSPGKYVARNKIDYDLDFIILETLYTSKTKQYSFISIYLDNNWENKIMSLISQAKGLVSKLSNNCLESLNVIKTAQTTIEPVSKYTILLKKSMQSVTTSIGKFNNFTQSINSVINNLGTIIREPGKWLITFNVAFDGLTQCIDNADEQLIAVNNFYSKQDFSNKLFNTYNIQQNSLKSLSDNLQMVENLAIYSTYNKIIVDNINNNDFIFKTNEDVLQSKKQFNAMYTDLINNNNIPVETKINITKVKKQMDDIYSDILNQVKNIIILKVDNPASLQNIVYQRYGNLDYYYDILSLNKNIIDVNNIVGDIKIYG